jgi:hypothetical protein
MGHGKAGGFRAYGLFQLFTSLAPRPKKMRIHGSLSENRQECVETNRPDRKCNRNWLQRLFAHDGDQPEVSARF